MEEKKIPQKPVKEVLTHFFTQDTLVSDKVKDTISKIQYSQKERIIVFITKSGEEIIKHRGKFIHTYGWFFFLSDSEKMEKKRNSD